MGVGIVRKKSLWVDIGVKWTKCEVYKNDYVQRRRPDPDIVEP